MVLLRGWDLLGVIGFLVIAVVLDGVSHDWLGHPDNLQSGLLVWWLTPVGPLLRAGLPVFHWSGLAVWLVCSLRSYPSLAIALFLFFWKASGFLRCLA